MTNEVRALIARGAYVEALGLVEADLNDLPDNPVGAAGAMERFLTQVMAADLVRRSSNDAKKELAFLERSMSLLPKLPPFPSRKDDSANVLYIFHMNRGNACARLERYREAIAAHELAWDAAVEPANQFKCLTYIGWSFLRAREPDLRESAWSAFARAKRTRDEHRTRMPAMLCADLLCGLAMQQLHEADVPGARVLVRQALHCRPTTQAVHALAECLSAGMTEVDQILTELAARAKAPLALKALRPLPLGI